MKKNKIERAIQKYSLGGNINSVKIRVKNKTLATRFISDDKSLLGELIAKNIEIEDSAFGVYNTSQLAKMLSIMNEDVDFTLVTIDKKMVTLDIKSSNMKASYVLSDLAVIPAAPELKNLPDFEIETKIDKEFITSFIKAKNALPDVDKFAIIPNTKRFKIVIGYSQVNTNRVTIPVKPDRMDFFVDTLQFNANFFKEILSANREAEVGTMSIASDGLIRLHFNIDDYNVTYYLVAQQS